MSAPQVQLAIDHGVATVTLDNPAALNAFAGDMRERLAAALDRVAADAEVRVLVITGAGRAFCAGGDVRHMVALRERGADFDALRPLLEAGRVVIERLVALPIPTLAAVNGPAAGAGMNLALACDLCVASDQATFGETFARIGLHLDWGGSWFLPRRVGLAQALELCWLAAPIDAAEALRLGLVNRVVPHASFATEIASLATRLAAAPATSVRMAKATLHASGSRTLAACFDAEIAAQRRCWESPDAEEGLRAFVEKRAPRFGAPAATAAPGSRFE